MDQNMHELIAKLGPSDKVTALEAMGFTRFRADHRDSCATRRGTGFICTCTAAPQSAWFAPDDVSNELGESFADRKAYADQRVAWDSESGQPRPEPWGI